LSHDQGGVVSLEPQPFLHGGKAAPKSQWVTVKALWYRPSDWLEGLRLLWGRFEGKGAIGRRSPFPVADSPATKSAPDNRKPQGHGSEGESDQTTPKGSAREDRRPQSWRPLKLNPASAGQAEGAPTPRGRNRKVPDAKVSSNQPPTRNRLSNSLSGDGCDEVENPKGVGVVSLTQQRTITDSPHCKPLRRIFAFTSG
jgi:hypothetical protein